jgi:hypothetical protein
MIEKNNVEFIPIYKCSKCGSHITSNNSHKFSFTEYFDKCSNINPILRRFSFCDKCVLDMANDLDLDRIKFKLANKMLSQL